MNVLFSEHESFYRDIGLTDCKDFTYTFGGCRFYKKNLNFFKHFDAFICAFYTMPHNTLITLNFHKLQKPTVICADGIFDFSNAMNNPMIRKYDMTMYHPIIQSHLFCVGNKEKLYFSNQVDSYNYLPKRVLSKSTMSELPHIKKTLITTANTAYFNNKEFKALSILMLDIIKTIIDSDIPFAVRIFDSKLLVFLEKELLVHLENDTALDFEQTLKVYTNIITTPSSIAITSMYHKRAVALLVYRDTPMLMQSGWLIPSGTIFKENLDSFLELSPQRMDIQTNILKTYLAENKMEDLLSKVIRQSKLTESINYHHINKNMLNMLNSNFNFNFEWFVRKLYSKIKKNKLIKKLKIILR